MKYDTAQAIGLSINLTREYYRRVVGVVGSCVHVRLHLCAFLRVAESTYCHCISAEGTLLILGPWRVRARLMKLSIDIRRKQQANRFVESIAASPAFNALSGTDSRPASDLIHSHEPESEDKQTESREEEGKELEEEDKFEGEKLNGDGKGKVKKTERPRTTVSTRTVAGLWKPITDCKWCSNS